jgi:hypothetical protein
LGGLGTLPGSDTSGLSTGGSSDPLSAVGSDPTGSMGAMDAVTGNPAGIGPGGAPDPGGGQQSGTTGADGAAAPQAPQPPPQQPSTPQSDAAQYTEVGTGPFSPAQQPTVAGPAGWTAQQVPASGGMPVNADTIQKMMAGQMYPPTGPGSSGSSTVPEMSPGAAAIGAQPNFVAQDFAQLNQPAVPFSQTAGTDIPGTAGSLPASDATSQDASATPDATSQDTPTTPAQTSPPAQGAAATTPPPSTQQQTGAAGQGGFPGAGGIGNIVRDLQGVMSGNPQSLMRLVQDVARMAGGPGGMPAALQQLAGGGQPGSGGQQGGGVATQGPYAGRPVNQVPWAPGYGPSTGRYSAPPGTPLPPTPGGGQNAPSAARRAAGTPPTAVPTQRVGPGGQPTARLPAPQAGQGISGQRQAGFQRGSAAAPSLKPDGNMPTGKAAVTPIVSNALRAGGASENAVRGILFNVDAESNFNPTSREPDQTNPRFRGTEAMNAHGLYQEGGDEWNNYTRWLKGRDWRDPKLQTQFLVANLKQNYPTLWQSMNTARTPEDAAKLFAKDYLRPSSQNLLARYNRINRGGVRRFTMPEQPPRPVPPEPPPDVPPADAWMQPSQGQPFTQRGDPSTFGGESYAGMMPSDQ